MSSELLEMMPIKSDGDIVRIRRRTRDLSKAQGFKLADVTRVVTAASELARNIYHYAQEDTVHCYALTEGRRKGIKLVFEDKGPGIEDIELVMEEGYSTGNSMGLGLPGAKRLVDKITIESEMGSGTKVEIIKWM